MQIDILTIGDEILLGQTIDTNSAWMAQALLPQGIAVRQITSIQDTPESIRSSVEAALDASPVVLVTGGLGPTRDDVTKETLAEMFRMPLVEHAPTLEAIEAFFARRNRPMLEVNRQQAWLPEGCTILPNPIGTAAGMWFERPSDGHIVVSMPGVPYEMKGLMTNEVIPRLIERFELPARVYTTLLTAGIGESFLAEHVKDWEDSLDARGVSIAYLPSPGQVRVRLGAVDSDRSAAEARVASAVSDFKALAGEWIASDSDEGLAAAVGHRLAAAGQTLSTAESCTGGSIGAEITSIAGSSAYFQGAVVAYANEVKMAMLDVPPGDLEAHGAVSEPVARAMAEGVRQKMGTDWSLATTGIAGPSGGSEEKPVGTVWIACAGPGTGTGTGTGTGMGTGTGTGGELRSQTGSGTVTVRRFQFAGNRERIIQQSVRAALDMLRRELDLVGGKKSST